MTMTMTRKSMTVYSLDCKFTASEILIGTPIAIIVHKVTLTLFSLSQAFSLAPA